MFQSIDRRRRAATPTVGAGARRAGAAPAAAVRARRCAVVERRRGAVDPTTQSVLEALATTIVHWAGAVARDVPALAMTATPDEPS